MVDCTKDVAPFLTRIILNLMQGRARLTPVAAGARATAATVRVLGLPGLVEGALEGLAVRPEDDLLPVEVSVRRRHLFLTRNSSRRLLTVGHALGILLLALPPP